MYLWITAQDKCKISTEKIFQYVARYYKSAIISITVDVVDNIIVADVDTQGTNNISDVTAEDGDMQGNYDMGTMLLGNVCHHDEECKDTQANCHMANMAVDHEDFEMENEVTLTTSTINKRKPYKQTKSCVQCEKEWKVQM